MCPCSVKLKCHDYFNKKKLRETKVKNIQFEKLSYKYKKYKILQINTLFLALGDLKFS